MNGKREEGRNEAIITRAKFFSSSIVGGECAAHCNVRDVVAVVDVVVTRPRNGEMK